MDRSFLLEGAKEMQDDTHQIILVFGETEWFHWKEFTHFEVK